MDIFKKSFDERKESDNLILNNVPLYFKYLDQSKSIDLLYRALLEKPRLISDLIESANLLSPKHLIDLIKLNRMDLVIECLGANKDTYAFDDLVLMKEILEKIDQMPDLGKIESVKNVLGKLKEKFICPDGHVNDLEKTFCTNSDCKKNIKGITKEQAEKIESFRLKIAALNDLLDIKN